MPVAYCNHCYKFIRGFGLYLIVIRHLVGLPKRCPHCKKERISLC